MLIFQLILNLLLIQDPPPGAWYYRRRDCFDTETFALATFNPAVAKVFCVSLNQIQKRMQNQIQRQIQNQIQMQMHSKRSAPPSPSLLWELQPNQHPTSINLAKIQLPRNWSKPIFQIMIGNNYRSLGLRWNQVKTSISPPQWSCYCTLCEFALEPWISKVALIILYQSCCLLVF